MCAVVHKNRMEEWVAQYKSFTNAGGNSENMLPDKQSKSFFPNDNHYI